MINCVSLQALWTPLVGTKITFYIPFNIEQVTSSQPISWISTE